MLITFLTIYNLVVTPLILVFPEIYSTCKDIDNSKFTSLSSETAECPSGDQEFVGN